MITWCVWQRKGLFPQDKKATKTSNHVLKPSAKIKHPKLTVTVEGNWQHHSPVSMLKLSFKSSSSKCLCSEKPCLKKPKKKCLCCWTGQKARQFRALAALPGDPGSVSSTYIATHNCLIPLASVGARHPHSTKTYMQAKHYMHKVK